MSTQSNDADMTSNADLAERYTRRRARLFPVLALFLLIQQASYFGHGNEDRMVDHVRIGAWVVMVAAVLVALMTGGGAFRSAAVRSLMNDEGTRANRASATSLGFVVAMVTALVLYPLRTLDDFDAGAVIHLIVSSGLVAAVLRFAWLERRALG